MELATADAVQPREGEAAFILQLRPPATAHADALAHELERFTSLYLERAAAEHVRFTPLGALTWALCAPSESVEEVDAACDELALTLFGDPASEAVHLARQPDHPRQEDFGIQNRSLSDEEGESVMEDLAEHEWDFGMEDGDDAAGDADLEAESASGVSAFDEDEDSIDLDDFVPPAEAQDDWQMGSPLPAAESIAFVEDEPDAAVAEEGDAEGLDELEAADEAASELNESDDTDLMLADEADAGAETEPAETDALDLDEAPEMETDLDLDLDLSGDMEAADADAFDASEPAHEADEGSFDIEDELDDFVLEGEESRPPHAGIWDEDVDTVDIDDIAASALHETRLGSNLDVAAELNAFREEMRAIARSIPSGGLDDTLSDFRASLESLSGELGQRVDGAAQRIEAAVGQLDIDRYDAASHRVESAATLMETSIQEALEALKRAGAAMAAPTVSDVFEAQEQDSL